MKKCKLFLHASFFPSGPSDRASKLAQLVEKSLENYYKTDERSQIKVDDELKCLIYFFRLFSYVWGKKPFEIFFES